MNQQNNEDPNKRLLVELKKLFAESWWLFFSLFVISEVILSLTKDFLFFDLLGPSIRLFFDNSFLYMIAYLCIPSGILFITIKIIGDKALCINTRKIIQNISSRLNDFSGWVLLIAILLYTLKYIWEKLV